MARSDLVSRLDKIEGRFKPVPPVKIVFVKEGEELPACIDDMTLVFCVADAVKEIKVTHGK